MKGRVALVTGSSGGLGYTMADALARAGCDVALHGLEPESHLQDRRRALEALGVKVSVHQADLADPSQIEGLVESVQVAHGGIDILVNSAVTRHFSAVESFPIDEWNRAIAVNLTAAFHTIRLTLPGMRAKGWGRIFNMTSVYGLRGVANRIDYVTTKSALIGMARAVAMETINQGITCNAICPGAVLTPTSERRIAELMAAENLDQDTATRKFLAGKQPGNRFVDAGHVADLVVFLCSPSGDSITGATLPVENGWLAS